ncbi:MAG: hypothetical protein CMO06_02360 [Thalassospira sp.]|uniref:substrate-binding periplasmic protein n=1 Tax=Thalassospira TaxID=168934 RepID=UPI000C4936CE|nr:MULTISPECIES: transporter substrate-binding domain-containing protein [Thalassospira]MAZ31980.1 hypothetical protein [Thalassospira sp.]
MGKRQTGVIVPRWLVMLLQIVWGTVWGISGAVAQEGNAGPERSQPKPEVLFAVGEWPPMITENVPGFGIHTERVTEAFVAMGYRVRYIFLPWRRAYELTARGEYAATFSWIWTPERSAEIIYPDHPVARAYQKGFYKKSRFPDGLEIDRIADLDPLGLRPVGVASYWYEVEFRRHGIEADIVTSSEAAWRFLDAGRADIFFEEEQVGWQDMKRILGEEAVANYTTTQPVQSDDMFILFSRNHPMGPALRDAFDRFLDTPNGQSMCRRWGVCKKSGENQSVPN